ncbi:MAG: HAMP domain-containing protein [Acidimicrobiaceae bacterium]|nr:ATP-binding protein [Acidimicrobiaceae bacterium]MXW61421.1 HAMP domain-containing protein [Acidimicrobiaceae bacterium]MXW75937.1 HAMP domain-containing protein [Acidimicrobiaceae bacterium]MYA75312.1 HAMP domain-containing protein [Acidimicrobiaceae bacterium]MYC41112.1 HAMP domain-containing protein [Acidimicrobiaceae bacterium]
MPGSVRLRLTLIVALITSAALSAAAWIGTKQVRDSLVDDAVEADVASLELVRAINIDGPDQGPITDWELEEAVFALTLIEADPQGKAFFSALLLDPGDPVPVLFPGGSVRMISADQSILENGSVDENMEHGQIIGAYTGDGPIVDAYTLFELSVERVTVGSGFFPIEHDSGLADLVFVSRNINGLEMIIAVDIRRTLETVDDFRVTLWATSGMLVVLAALATWFLTGRVLAPVRRITARAGEISGGTLHERVPVPDTSDEIADLGLTMNSMLDRLESSDKKRRQFVSDASHELRTPVAVLQSEAEAALRLPDATVTEELANSVLVESERLGHLIEGLLVLARSDEGTTSQAGRHPVDLDDIVLAEAIRSRRLPVDKRSVSAGRVLGGVDQLTCIVAQLLDNAARHGKSLVAVGLVEKEGQVMLWVDDDGAGIPSNARQKVFERFARLEDARSRDKGGAGIGLAVVASTVADLGGTVHVEVAPIGGARFVVCLPAAA